MHGVHLVCIFGIELNGGESFITFKINIMKISKKQFAEQASIISTLVTMGFTAKQSAEIAWERKRFIENMEKNIVNFSYTKVSGNKEYRYAKGTLKKESVSENEHELFGKIDNSYPSNPLIVFYWDLDKNSIRQFYLNKSNILNIAA